MCAQPRVLRVLIEYHAGILKAFIVFLALIPLSAQEYVISTVVGGAPLPTPVLGAEASISPPSGIAVDSNGNIFFTSRHSVFQLDRSGILTRLAGTSRPGYSGDGGPATNAQLNTPTSVAIDNSGNLFVLDSRNRRVRRISPDGIITTFAGNGDFDGGEPPRDGGAAASTPLRPGATGLAIDNSGALLLSDSYADNGRIRRIAPDGTISTIAGGGSEFPGDGGPAKMASLKRPAGVATDAAGNLYFADPFAHCVRKVDKRGVITTVAGTGVAGLSGDGGPARQAQVTGPKAVGVDARGNVYIADSGNYRLRKVSPDGVISTIAGAGDKFPGDGLQAADVSFCSDRLALAALATDRDGNVYLANCWIQRISPSGILSNLAGDGTYNLGGNGGPASNAQLFGPADIVFAPDGSLLIADSGNDMIRKVGLDGVITTFAGNQEHGYHGDGGPATGTSLATPDALVMDSSGNLYIADSANARVRKVSPDGIITTVAGNGTTGSSGDGGPAQLAKINYPRGIAVDSAGNLFLADANESRVRKVSTDGIITTVAGDGTLNYSGDGRLAANAQINSPWGVATDSKGNLFIADTGNNRIRKVDADGAISTIAGNGDFGSFGDSGEGGAALSASITAPFGVALDEAGNLFVAALYGIKKVSVDGKLTSIAGNGMLFEDSGDGGSAKLASMRVRKLRVDLSGRVFLADDGPPSSGSERSADGSVRVLTPVQETVLISSIRDGATQLVAPVTPGKILAIYGLNLGPSRLLNNHSTSGVFPANLAGTEVFFDGVAAPILYASTTQIGVVAPYGISGESANVTVSYQGQTSAPYKVEVATSAPGIFSSNGTGAGQAAAVNADGSLNDAAHPVKIGGSLSLYATGEGQTTPAGQDGKVTGTAQLPRPLLNVKVSVDGQEAPVTYAGAVPGQVAGMMQIVIQIPLSVRPCGYVPVFVQVGDHSTTAGAAWIAVSGN